MFSQTIKQRSALLGAMLATLCIAATSTAQVIAQPAAVTFHSKDEVKTINLTHNGQPIPASAITGHKIYINENDYDEFFSYTKADGQISLSPNDQTELGSYKFVISTSHGPVTVDVYTPLDEAANSIENQAKHLGITVDELKTRLGLFTTGARERVSISIPPVCYAGQALNFNMPHQEGRVYTWRVNGTVVAQGENANSVVYTFPEPGAYVFEYTESVNGTIAASAIASTNVLAMPALKSYSLNTPVVLRAPDGYEYYAWKIGDQVLVEGAEFNHAFPDPGEYVVVLHAERPLVEGMPPQKVTTYKVRIAAPAQ